jgi:hypothetical protein
MSEPRGDRTAPPPDQERGPDPGSLFLAGYFVLLAAIVAALLLAPLVVRG